MFKSYVQKKLEEYVRRYFAAHPNVKLIGVAGSVGKTSTKAAIAEILTEGFRVRMELKNYNTEISAPMAILGIDMPEKVRSFWAWRKVFKIAKQRIATPDDVDIIVQELGTDRVGDMANFMRYLKLDVAIVTGVTAEHMEQFVTLENVAKEELMAANMAEIAFINRDDVDGEAFAGLLTNQNIVTYGNNDPAQYSFMVEDFDFEKGYTGVFKTVELGDIPATVRVFGEHSLRPVLAAVAVGCKMGMSREQIQNGLLRTRPVAGRMNVLKGLAGSMIIDDTYNSSPAAMSAALKTLYEVSAPSRIAVIGDMNEMGAESAAEHEKIGKMCDPALLSWVITVGAEAEKYLAPAAQTRGCQVRSFKDAVSAVPFIMGVLEREYGAAVLFKGSQGGIYLEEIVKDVLHSSSDVVDLVRQSPAWMQEKREFFAKVQESDE
ncbi:UDP-N-acetylmuramoyl-tripeptide--D-alanyl-D-alanine ligase [Candidatus Saccharibacteria bacterium]|nr:UDP-N-acetylmuramoyl-tripeptide--D-alanyl-D-alanine ligase [Candidatus Saccharibacteria bacterium]